MFSSSSSPSFPFRLFHFKAELLLAHDYYYYSIMKKTKYSTSVCIPCVLLFRLWCATAGKNPRERRGKNRPCRFTTIQNFKKRKGTPTMLGDRLDLPRKLCNSSIVHTHTHTSNALLHVQQCATQIYTYNTRGS